MTHSTCEVAIIGGGLAGCSAAISLARAGVNVTLFESGALPRHRVCGEFLSPESRATLARLKVLHEIEDAGARPVHLARFHSGGRSTDFALGAAAGIALSRFSLDPLLWNVAQRAGARAFLKSKVRGLMNEENGYSFETNGEKWRAQAIILATGRGGAPKAEEAEEARFCGLKAHFAGVKLEPGIVEMHLFKGGYCGLVRIEGEATNACLMVDYREFPKGPPGQFWEALLAQNSGLRQRLGQATRITDWQTTANVSFETFRPVGEGGTNGVLQGVLCAGDAAGYIHPLTGDGMAMALQAGELAGTVARLGVRGLGQEEATRLYRAAWEREFSGRLAVVARLHPLALRPEWAKPLLPVLSLLPSLRSAMVRGTRGHLKL